MFAKNRLIRGAVVLLLLLGAVSARAAVLEAPSYVNDGTNLAVLGMDRDFQNYANTIYAAWPGRTDQPLLDHYEYSVGTSPGASNVKAWTSTGIATYITPNPFLSLNAGITYYVNVRAVDKLGTAGAVRTSNGITVDQGLPTNSILQPASPYQSIS